MKKARALSTTCTSLVLLGAGVASAELPVDRCYARDYDAAHLAAHPGQGVAALRLWFFDETADAQSSRSALVQATMAEQGQATRDGVGGRQLTQYATCDTATDTCYVECDGGSFVVSPVGTDGLRLATSFFAMGDVESCGGFTDLAEQQGSETVYQLTAAPAALCESLWRPHPLPEAGCYGIDYADMGRGQGVLGLRLRLDAPDSGYAFPQARGVLAVRLPNGGRAQVAGMGGVRVQVPVWCLSRDGRCWSQVDDATFALTPEGTGATLATMLFPVFGPEDQSFDLAMPGQSETRHALRAMPDTECRGMD